MAAAVGRGVPRWRANPESAACRRRARRTPPPGDTTRRSSPPARSPRRRPCRWRCAGGPRTRRPRGRAWRPPREGRPSRAGAARCRWPDRRTAARAMAQAIARSVPLIAILHDAGHRRRRPTRTAWGSRRARGPGPGPPRRGRGAGRRPAPRCRASGSSGGDEGGDHASDLGVGAIDGRQRCRHRDQVGRRIGAGSRHRDRGALDRPPSLRSVGLGNGEPRAGGPRRRALEPSCRIDPRALGDGPQQEPPPVEGLLQEAQGLALGHERRRGVAGGEPGFGPRHRARGAEERGLTLVLLTPLRQVGGLRRLLDLVLHLAAHQEHELGADHALLDRQPLRLSQPRRVVEPWHGSRAVVRSSRSPSAG